MVKSAMVAKIADLDVARILSDLRVATMTKAPGGAAIYMPPPEALEAKSEEEKDSCNCRYLFAGSSCNIHRESDLSL